MIRETELAVYIFWCNIVIFLCVPRTGVSVGIRCAGVMGMSRWIDLVVDHIYGSASRQGIAMVCCTGNWCMVWW